MQKENSTPVIGYDETLDVARTSLMSSICIFSISRSARINARRSREVMSLEIGV